MLDKIISFIDALIVHALFLTIILFSMDLPKLSLFTTTVDMDTKAQNVVNENAVLAELERLRKEEYLKNATQQAQQYELERKNIEYEQFIIQESAYLDTLKKQQKEEKQQFNELRQHRQLEKKALKKLIREKKNVEKSLKK